MYDAIVVGAGAAGLMTTITAARKGTKVLLLDSREKIGAKILMSGGTRCNVTNKTVSEKDYNSEDLMRVRNILRSFDNQATLKFFKELGVELILEDTDKYFPKSNSGKTVLDALVRELNRLKVSLIAPAKVTAIDYREGVYHVKGADFSHQAKRVVIATGGLSYPASGSDGAGFGFAKAFGHDIIPTTPSLTPLLSSDKIFAELSGISLTAKLTLKIDSKKVFSTTGGFLFTHQGFSGPTALDISRHWLRRRGKKVLEISFLPDLNDESFIQYIQEVTAKHPKKTVKGLLLAHLPQRLVDVLTKKARVSGETLLNQLAKDRRLSLMTTLLHHPLDITGVVGYSKAEATAGGVNLAQLNPKSLESLHQPGLFFVGEVCDVDGRIGGFNFQWAWASGYAAGLHLKDT